MSIFSSISKNMFCERVIPSRQARSRSLVLFQWFGEQHKFLANFFLALRKIWKHNEVRLVEGVRANNIGAVSRA